MNRRSSIGKQATGKRGSGQQDTRHSVSGRYRHNAATAFLDHDPPSAVYERAQILSQQLQEEPPPAEHARRWRLGFYVAGWTLIGALFAAWILAPSLADSSVDIPWSQVASEMLRWYLWGALAPGIWWLAERYPMARQNLVKLLTVNIAAAMVVTSVYAFFDLLKRQVIYQLTDGVTSGAASAVAPFSDWPRMVFWGVEYHLLTYFCILAAIHAFLYYDKFREREIKTSRLEAQLALARLEVLKTQLHPHFLFNTLNAISSLMHRDVDAADRMIALLSDLLRLSLDKDDRHQVPLRNELEFLDRYLAIEKIRFRDRLRVDMDVDPGCLEAMVPRLILQPLVENSVRHGIAMRSAAGLVGIQARRKGNRLLLAVTDDGPGLTGDKPQREGVGLANTRARLRQLYRSDYRFELLRAESGGLLVHIEIPFENTPRFTAVSLV